MNESFITVVHVIAFNNIEILHRLTNELYSTQKVTLEGYTIHE